MTVPVRVFDLPERLSAKADPALIADDEEHLSAVARNLERSIAALIEHRSAALRGPGGSGQQALDRDLEVHRLTTRLRALRRYGLDLCLGRLVFEDDPEPVYVGRFGLTDDEGRRLLVDWRSPAAEPFFAATRAHPLGLASRRRYRWNSGRICDYWDEAFTPRALAAGVALDDQSAFIASLGGSRSARMRDVLGTIQADQDAAIRAGSRGALVVDGGPGTGKTVVALHRAAYLLYSDPRLAPGRGGVLFVGPSAAYLSYVEDVLPSLGEEGVHSCTLAELVPEGASAVRETDPAVARLKSSAAMVAAIENAVRMHERPPRRSVTIETDWAEISVEAADWAEAFDAAEPGVPHNEARDQVWEELLGILLQKHGEADEEVPPALLRASFARDEELAGTFARAWPLLDPVGLVADLWSVPGHLERCAPGLDVAEVRMLQRSDARAWTDADLPLLDAARQRIGDPGAPRRRRDREKAIARERERMDAVIDDLLAADHNDELHLAMMLREQDAQNSLLDEAALPGVEPDELSGPFAHIVVDEAQELTDAQWRMLVSRCPSRSFTIVGDRAQARHGFTETWPERLARVSIDPGGVTVATLSVNYRTPEEVMAVAEPAIRAALPEANVPAAVRRSGVPVEFRAVEELDAVVDGWLAAQDEGVGCVITADRARSAAGAGVGGAAAVWAGDPRIRSLTPELAKGLEFDLVVVVDPDAFGEGIEGAVDRYVAMTRATERLVVLLP
ncbi:RNA polymerase recycling motor ATPase HelR [Herbiconiux sp. 11R-BC]|uniref:RNA polymerase recycling motor ATPase HelR n=1 Tax=Herbiconiux sp. 11R-BC TaxID=3111637 RepID=UPI003C0FBD3D